MFLRFLIDVLIILIAFMALGPLLGLFAIMLLVMYRKRTIVIKFK